MRKTGKITNIQPKGGYQGRNGWITTFTMTVDCNGDIVVGEIGTKSQQYPKQVGQEICVDVTVDNHGTKLKNVNLEYQNQQQPAQGGSQPRQSNNKDVDWDKVAMGKCRSLVVQAAVSSLQLECKNFDQADKLVDYMMHGQSVAQTFAQEHDLPPDNVHEEDF